MKVWIVRNTKTGLYYAGNDEKGQREFGREPKRLSAEAARRHARQTYAKAFTDGKLVAERAS